MAPPSLSSPARSTASAVSRPFSQPSALAASAARRPTSADFSAASASRSPLFPLPSRRGPRRRRCLADLPLPLDGLVPPRRELGVPGDLAAHLAHLARRELPADGLPPAGGPGPQEPWPVTGMLRGRARAVRLPAPAPVLAHRPPPEVADHAELREQPVPLGLQLRKRRLGHGHSSSGFDCQNQTAIITREDVGPLHMCRTPGRS